MVPFLRSEMVKLENIKLFTGPCPRFVRDGGMNMFPYFMLYLLSGGGIDGSCSITKYSPFMIYLHLQ